MLRQLLQRVNLAAHARPSTGRLDRSSNRTGRRAAASALWLRCCGRWVIRCRIPAEEPPQRETEPQQIQIQQHVEQKGRTCVQALHERRWG